MGGAIPTIAVTDKTAGIQFASAIIPFIPAAAFCSCVALRGGHLGQRDVGQVPAPLVWLQGEIQPFQERLGVRMRLAANCLPRRNTSTQ